MVPNSHIRPEEIRIGNLIKSTVDGSIITVTDIYHACLEPETNCGWIIDDKGTFLRDCEPITLTEDWFKKAGFHYNDEFKYWIDGTWELAFKKDGKSWWVMSHSEYDGSTWFLKKIKYVHEFQNIYYQINGFDPYDKEND